jgi:biopolymer transport protein ExbD
MTVPVPRLIRMGPLTLLPLSYVSFILLVLAMIDVPAPGGPVLAYAGTGLPVGPAPLTVGISRQGEFFLAEGPVPADELPRRIQALAATRPAAAGLYVSADRDAPYERVLLLAAAARAAGFRELVLATICPSGREMLVRECARAAPTDPRFR